MPNVNFIPHAYDLYSALHIADIYSSYFVFFIASIAAAAYLIQDGLIKSKRMGTIFNRLPDLFPGGMAYLRGYPAYAVIRQAPRQEGGVVVAFCFLRACV